MFTGVEQPILLIFGYLKWVKTCTLVIARGPRSAAESISDYVVVVVVLEAYPKIDPAARG